MKVKPVSLVPMAFVRSGQCPDVAAFREHLLEAGVEAGPIAHPFYAPRGEFRVTDPDGYALMVTHT